MRNESHSSPPQVVTDVVLSHIHKARMRIVTTVASSVAALALLTTPGVHAQGPGEGETLISNVGQSGNGSNAELDADVPLRAQRFFTGRQATGYILTSVGIDFEQMADTSPQTRLAVTVNRAADRVVGDRFVVPGAAICALSHPPSHSVDLVSYFEAPSGGCTLHGSASYFIVVHRTDTGGEGIGLAVTDRDAWDEGMESQWWAISPHRHHSDGDSWDRTTGEAHMIDVRGRPCVALWCATMTVGTDTDDASLGWSELGSLGGELSDDDFVDDEHYYELDQIRLTTDGALGVTFSRHGAGDISSQHTRDGMELHVGGMKFGLGAADLQEDDRTVRWGTGPDWSDSQAVLLKMVKIASPPRAPEGLAAVAKDGRVKLIWKTPRGGSGGSTIIKHEYRQKTAGGSYGDWQLIHQSGADQAHDDSYTVSDLTNGTEYSFQVRAGNANGLGGESNEASALPHQCDVFWCSTLTVGQLELDAGAGRGYHEEDSIGSLSRNVFGWAGDAFTVRWLYVLDSGAIRLGISGGDPDADRALAETMGDWEDLDFNRLEIGESGYHIGDGSVEHDNLSEDGRYRGTVEVEWSISGSPLRNLGSVSVRLVEEAGGL